MRLHFHLRHRSLSALAICLIFFFALAGPVGAAPPADKGKSNAPGQEKKDEPAPADSPSAGTPTAADHPEGDSTHDAASGPGGQTCDGDPSPNSTGGANGPGNYNNTCPAGPSQNGAGDGQATGKPCAGCVGNADDKNPPGQATSGPADHNNGYECDQKGRSAREGNNGVGFGNPAHTGCTSTPPPPPPSTCPGGAAIPASGTCPTPQGPPACAATTCREAVAASGEVRLVPLAMDRPVEVLGVSLISPVDKPVVAAANLDTLARTGASPLVPLRLALLLLMVGLTMVAATRITRRRGQALAVVPRND